MKQFTVVKIGQKREFFNIYCIISNQIFPAYRKKLNQLKTELILFIYFIETYIIKFTINKYTKLGLKKHMHKTIIS